MAALALAARALLHVNALRDPIWSSGRQGDHWKGYVKAGSGEPSPADKDAVMPNRPGRREAARRHRLGSAGAWWLLQASVVFAPFLLELTCHFLKMIEGDPRRPTLSGIVLLGF